VKKDDKILTPSFLQTPDPKKEMTPSFVTDAKNQTPISNLFATTPTQASPFSSISSIGGDAKKEPIGNAAPIPPFGNLSFPWSSSPAPTSVPPATSGYSFQQNDAKNIPTAFDMKKQDTAVPTGFTFGMNNPPSSTTSIVPPSFNFGVDRNTGSNIGVNPPMGMTGNLGLGMLPTQGFNFNNPTLPDTNPSSALLGSGTVFTFSNTPSSTPSTQGRPAPKRFKSKSRKNT